MGNAPLFVGYDAIEYGGKRKSTADDNPDKTISRQLDELERISKNERDKFLGRDYFREINDFYNIDDGDISFPSFRPRVRIPQLQTLVLNEATDISDSSPKIYIVEEGKRDEQREKYFQALWRQGCINNRILESFIWAMLSNLGFLQIGFDPHVRRGRGGAWVEMRRPETVYPDPYATSDRDWSWVMWEDWMYIDEVHRRWPEKGRLVRPHLYAGDPDPYGSTGGSLEFPEASPLSNTSETPGKKIFRDNRVRVRHCYLFDNTREKIQDYAGSHAEAIHLVHPRFQYKYPDGRWITECEGVVLADGNNWCPQLPDDERGTFPLVRILAMPAITNFWGPAPIRLSKSLQELSERMHTQLFENMVRLNNGVIIIKNNTGLDPSAIGWLPGEVLTINQGSEAPTVINPPQLPQQMSTVPLSLLALQKELQGYSQARQGQASAGNISADLFDATLWQSQTITRLRARLLAESIQRLASILFYVNARYISVQDTLFTGMEKGEPDFASWRPPTSSLDSFDVHLDEGSLRVMSASALRSVVGALSKSGLLPTRTVLEAFDVPAAGEIADEKEKEMALAALSKLKRPR